ncbi:MAG: serine/threonine-protein kinase, partial [Sandaracinaceae bacterium]
MSDRPPPNPDSSLDEAAFEIPAPSLSDDDDDDIIGKIIDGRYQVESLIGAGGMGFVYMTMHVQLGQRYVLKTLRPELMSSESSRERFLREARSTSMIRHPHVVDVKDFGVHPTFGAYYVMERLEGRDLEQIMREGKRIEPRRAVRIARQVASALGEAHAQGIIHRDLKPANVFLLEPSGDPDHVKVLDFGLARVMDANRRLTETGAGDRHAALHGARAVRGREGGR